MRLSNRIGMFVFVGTLLLNSVFAEAQEAAVEPDHKNFSVSTSVSLTLSGPSYTTRFQLVDELGMHYDVMSLVEDPAVRESLNLSEEQFSQMLALKHAVTSELQNKLASALTTADGKKEIESRFNEVEDDIRSIMDPEQVLQLEQVKTQRSIERYGLAEFLGTKAMKKELGLSEAELVSIKEAHAESATHHRKQVDSFVEQANLALIAELSEKDQKKLDEVLSGNSKKEFLGSTLFVDKKSLRHRNSAHIKNQLGLLRIKRVREYIELTEDQFTEIQAINKQAREMSEAALKDAMDQVLSRRQVEQLNQQVVKSETSKFGTVNELSYGLISKLLELTSEESARIFEAGKRISGELAVDVEHSKNELFLESIGSISAGKRDRILSMSGASTPKRYGSKPQNIR